MIYDAENFPSTIMERIKSLNTSAFAVETASGLPPDAIRNVLRAGAGKAGPTLARAEQICRALDLEFYIGPRREVDQISPVSPDQLQEYVSIPLHETLLSAGAGADVGERVIDKFAFKREWLQRIGVPASAARLARVRGDSMSPTLFDGDLVLLDTQKQMPPMRHQTPEDRRRSPIYAFADGLGARIKRIEHLADDHLVLLSDNPDYAPEFRLGSEINELNIIGKVVWWGHTVRE